MLKRVNSLILVLVMLLSTVVAGCGKKAAETKPVDNAGKQTGQVEPFKLPLTSEKKTLVWATRDSWYAPASYNSGLEVFKKMEEATNVHIQWDVNASDYATKMKLRLTSGTNLPDIVAVPGDPTAYAESGVIIPLEDLIAKYAPNIQRIFKEYPGVKETFTGPDGHIYTLSAITKEGDEANPFTWVIRKDWLDKLGLKMPVTLDDWYNVLTAFKQKDPNGNGKPDEIPLFEQPTIFGEAFGINLSSGSDFQVVDGKVEYKWADPRMPEYLAYANKLYKAGLLDKDYVGQSDPNDEAYSSDDQQSKVAKNIVGAYFNAPDWSTAFQKPLIDSGVKDASYVPIIPAKGDKGDCFLTTGTGALPRGTGITKACKDPVLAIKLLDYMWSEEGIRYLAWGIEGKTYTMVDGKPQLTQDVLNNAKGLGASDVLRTVGAWPTFPWVQQRAQYDQMMAGAKEFKGFPDYIKPVLKTEFPATRGTKDETDRVAAIDADLKTYREEMIAKFTIGKEPLSNFPKFIEKMKEMGLDEMVQIKQTQYDRYTKLMQENK